VWKCWRAKFWDKNTGVKNPRTEDAGVKNPKTEDAGVGTARELSLLPPCCPMTFHFSHQFLKIIVIHSSPIALESSSRNSKFGASKVKMSSIDCAVTTNE
jgi:hypothetical protein